MAVFCQKTYFFKKKKRQQQWNAKTLEILKCAKRTRNAHFKLSNSTALLKCAFEACFQWLGAVFPTALWPNCHSNVQFKECRPWIEKQPVTDFLLAVGEVISSLLFVVTDLLLALARIICKPSPSQFFWSPTKNECWSSMSYTFLMVTNSRW